MTIAFASILGSIVEYSASQSALGAQCMYRAVTLSVECPASSRIINTGDLPAIVSARRTLLTMFALIVDDWLAVTCSDPSFGERVDFLVLPRELGTPGEHQFPFGTLFTKSERGGASGVPGHEMGSLTPVKEMVGTVVVLAGRVKIPPVAQISSVGPAPPLGW